MLGDLTVTDDRGERIEPPKRQQRFRNLICVLAWDDWAVPARRLKRMIWEPADRDYTSALTTLVHKVRQVLPPGRLVNEYDETTGDQRYRLVVNPGDTVDTTEFTVLCTLAEKARRERDPRRAVDLWADALALWRGEPGEPPLPDLPDTSAVRAFTEPLLSKRRQITETHVETSLALGRHGPDLARQIRDRLRYDQANEHLYGLLMLCLYRDGRRGDALMAYNEAAAVLDDLLDVPPGAALARMRERIVADDPGLRRQEPAATAPGNLETGARATIRGVTDYMMGGKDHYSADREFVDKIVAETGTDSVHLPNENRDCLMRMVRFMAKLGIRQFLDVGSGLPDAFSRHVHEVAQQITSEARVLYVDKDPLVGLYAQAVMTDGGRTVFRQADLQDVETVLHEARSHLDLSEPVALVFSNTLQYAGEPDEDLGTGALAETVQRYLDVLAPGSHLAITHITGDGLDPRLRGYIDSTLPDAPLAQNLRSPAQIQRLFCGLPLVEPGITDVANWRPEQPFVQRGLRIIGGIAVKPPAAP